jgi:hypothetical protein
MISLLDLRKQPQLAVSETSTAEILANMKIDHNSVRGDFIRAVSQRLGKGL